MYNSERGRSLYFYLILQLFFIMNCPFCGSQLPYDSSSCRICKQKFNLPNLRNKYRECFAEIEELEKISDHTFNQVRNFREKMKKLKNEGNYLTGVIQNAEDLGIFNKDQNLLSYLYEENPIYALSTDLQSLKKSFSQVETHSFIISGTTTSSLQKMDQNLESVLTYINNSSNGEYLPLKKKIEVPPVLIDKDKFIHRLSKIDKRLVADYRGAWDALINTNNENSFKAVAHHLRELISIFLQVFDFDDKVSKMNWCEKSDNNRPTQKSRAIYAIISDYTGFSWDSPRFFPYVEAAENIRKEYNKLSKQAHYRKLEAPLSVKSQMELHIKKTQSAILAILEHREDFLSYIQINGISAKHISAINGIPIDKISEINGIPIRKSKKETEL